MANHQSVSSKFIDMSPRGGISMITSSTGKTRSPMTIGFQNISNRTDLSVFFQTPNYLEKADSEKSIKFYMG